jgi:hypothetical protein
MLEGLLLAASTWVTPIQASGPSLHAVPAVQVGLDSWIRPDVWSVPFYSAGPDQPKRQLLYNEGAWSKVASGAWRRYQNSPAVEDEIVRASSQRFPYTGNVFSSVSAANWMLPPKYNQTKNPESGSAEFFIGDAMVPAPGPDGHMAVMQPDGHVLETYGTIRLSSGTVVALSYSVTSPAGMGDGYQNGQTASMLPVYLGLLDDEEAQQGTIHHALAITVPARLLRPQIDYPAFAMDRGALTESPQYSGTLSMGARLALPASLDLRTLHLATAEGAAIASAAQHYGFIIVDRGGDGISLRAVRNPGKSDSRIRSWNIELAADLETIFSQLVSVEAPAH